VTPSPFRLALALLAAVLVACAGSGVADTTVSTTSEAVSTTSEEGATTTTVAATTTTSSAFEELAVGALVTPTGVVVSVIEKGATGYVVRTPCGGTATIGNGEPVGPVRVVLDPGHGGEIDTGAVGSNGLREADLNLTVARAVEQELLARGIPTVLTRTGDYAVRIGTRAQLADDLGAEILVSIHHNAPTPGPSTTPGTEIFIKSDSERSRRLGGLIWEHMVDGLSGIEGVHWTAAPDSGVLRVLNPEGEDAYGMVRLPETVSVLAELAYISNSSEAEMLATDEYLEVATQSLGDAIEIYLEENDLGAGYVLEPRVFRPQRGISEDACVDPELG
jgi:N-acetylmuramoyl-L-alanine amidase